MIDLVDPARHWVGAPYAPRAWQAEALPRALAAVAGGRAAITHAVMGAGKSALIAELAASVVLAPDQRVVVSTPTVALVEQLAATIEARRGRPVDRYYTHGRGVAAGVIVACNPSLGALATDLREAGLAVALWIVDEAHGSESETLRTAAEQLQPLARHGLTATPYRADPEQGLSLWDELSYSYGPAAAIRDGVVVPFEVRPWTGGRVSIDDACVEMIRAVIAEGGGPGIVSAGGSDAETKKPMQGIEDAEAFAARLVGEGIRALAVHSRLARAEVARRLELLRMGELDCLVHVALLREGVDLPWLRWLCLRAAIGSSVAYAQQLGRVLRAAPGKARAVVLDPHDLCGLHSLSLAAVLGGEASDPPPKAPTLVVLDFLADLGLDTAHPVALEVGAHGEARVRTELEVWLRRLTVALDTAGIIQRDPASAVPANGRWRSAAASPRQLETITKHLPRLRDRGIPEPVMALLRYVWRYAARLSRGAASDVIDVALALQRRRWTPVASEILDAGSVTEGRRIRCPRHGLVRPRWVVHRADDAELLCPRCGHVFRPIARGSADFLRYPQLEPALPGVGSDDLEVEA